MNKIFSIYIYNQLMEQFPTYEVLLNIQFIGSKIYITKSEQLVNLLTTVRNDIVENKLQKRKKSIRYKMQRDVNKHDRLLIYLDIQNYL